MPCAQYWVSETNGVVAAQATQHFAGSFAELVYPGAAWGLQISGWWIIFVLVRWLILYDFLSALGLRLPTLSVNGIRAISCLERWKWRNVLDSGLCSTMVTARRAWSIGILSQVNFSGHDDVIFLQEYQWKRKIYKTDYDFHFIFVKISIFFLQPWGRWCGGKGRESRNFLEQVICISC